MITVTLQLEDLSLRKSKEIEADVRHALQWLPSCLKVTDVKVDGGIVSFTSAELDELRSRVTVEWDTDGDLALTDEGCEPYIVEASRIDTVEKLLVWILHLSEKAWMDPVALQKVAELVTSRYGWKLPWAC